ncbi:MAG: hypothetical protein ABJO27_15565 [Pseudoruegeria sp.]
MAVSICSATIGIHAFAECSKEPIDFKWKVEAEDIRVSGEFVIKTVLGKKFGTQRAMKTTGLTVIMSSLLAAIDMFQMAMFFTAMDRVA